MAQTREVRLNQMRAYYVAHREERLPKMRTYGRAWYETHREETKARHGAYREAHREERRSSARAYRETHREELKAKGRAYYAMHRKEQAARVSAWARVYPEVRAERTLRYQALKRGATIGRIDLKAIKIRERMLCCICGRKVAPKDFSLDHSIPLSLGGPHSQENLRVAHRRCNYRRGVGRLPVQLVLF